MLDDQSTCTQVVELASACEDDLSIKNFVNDLKVYMGRGGTKGSAISVTVGDYYNYDSADKTYTLSS